MVSCFQLYVVVKWIVSQTVWVQPKKGNNLKALYNQNAEAGWNFPAISLYKIFGKISDMRVGLCHVEKHVVSQVGSFQQSVHQVTVLGCSIKSMSSLLAQVFSRLTAGMPWMTSFNRSSLTWTSLMTKKRKTERGKREWKSNRRNVKRRRG